MHQSENYQKWLKKRFLAIHVSSICFFLAAAFMLAQFLVMRLIPFFWGELIVWVIIFTFVGLISNEIRVIKDFMKLEKPEEYVERLGIA